jgi:hypothetical protein
MDIVPDTSTALKPGPKSSDHGIEHAIAEQHVRVADAARAARSPFAKRGNGWGGAVPFVYSTSARVRARV